MKFYFILFLSLTLYSKELPKNILLEKYLIAAQEYENKQEYKKAIKNFEEIEDLHISLPKEFFYRYATNLYYDKRYEKSKEYFTQYLLESSREDKYYKSALKFMILLEDEEEEEKKLVKRCDALPDLIQENKEKCLSTCERTVNTKIDTNLYKYQNYTSYELYNTWYPQCLKKCRSKDVKPLQREYKRKCND